MHFYVECVYMSPHFERKACAGEGNVQREHFLLNNEASFTELSNSSTTNWV